MESDTVALLKECNSGIKMGINSLDDVLDRVQKSDLREILRTAKKEHEKLGDESHAILLKYHEDGKEPHPVAKMMASVKTGVKLTVQESDTAKNGVEIIRPVFLKACGRNIFLAFFFAA